MYPHAFIRLFTADEAIINSGAISLRIVSYGFAFYGLGMVMVQAFNGAGDTRTPTYINIIAFWLIEIPLAWALSMPLGQQEQGVYYGIIIAESSLTILAAILFKQGRWKKEIV
jgi:Na+-driven multidrug efflux pump